MEAIKCPNCGSEKCKELTKEQWQCLACDNIFLIYDSSKEFRQTDEHISEVHEDLKNQIKELAQKSGNTELEQKYENAFHLIEIGKYAEAEEKFNVLCKEFSMYYKSWYGKILIHTRNLQRTEEEVIQSREFFTFLKYMRACKDYPEEIEKKLNAYLQRVIQGNKAMVQQRYETIKKEHEEQEKLKADRTQRLKQELGENQEKQKALEEVLKEQVGKADAEKRKAGLIINLIAWVALIFLEWKVVKIIFINWIGKSIDAVNAPLPSAGAAGAGNSFGNAALNFVAIPVKFIIGVVIAVAIFSILIHLSDLIKKGKTKQIEGKLITEKGNLESVVLAGKQKMEALTSLENENDGKEDIIRNLDQKLRGFDKITKELLGGE